MLDLFFNGMMAFQQAAMILGGGLCFLIGAGIIGNGLYWRLKAERVDATIIGVRKKGIYYYPVYRYILGSGEQRETISSTGTNSMRGMETGKAVRLMIFPDKPEEARPAASILYLIVGLFFLGPGILFLKIALFSYPLTVYSYGMIGVLVLMAALKIRRHIIPKEQRGTVAEWKEKRKAERAKEWESSSLTTMEEFRDTPEGIRAVVQERQQARIAMPILLVIGCAMIYGGYHFGQKMISLTEHGTRAEGKVVALETSRNSDGDTSYYPVVEFRDDKGRNVRFRDGFGSSHPSYRTGDDVTVLYLPDMPQPSAVIDRGWMNWLLPGGLGGVGVLFLLMGFSMLRYRDQAA
ncbi:MAG: DUF3592 domain-containing protein [Alphaproteobacteria bacterium]|nr:MAG: DUF3592 domain-containing protein [Alphaproteobacteria bacterium]